MTESGERLPQCHGWDIVLGQTVLFGKALLSHSWWAWRPTAPATGRGGEPRLAAGKGGRRCDGDGNGVGGGRYVPAGGADQRVGDRRRDHGGVAHDLARFLGDHR